MARLTRALPILYSMVHVLLIPCTPSPVPYSPGHVQHVDLPLPPLSPDIGAGLGLQVYDTHLGKEASYDWRGDGSNFPIPFSDNVNCNSNKPRGFACDPDKNLQLDHVTDLSFQIEEIISNTKCQCPKNRCFTSLPMGRFSIGIAVASNITGSSDNIQKLRIFSGSLKDVRWQTMQRCNDFLVIALETTSRTIYMSPDRIVSNMIPDKCAKEILEKTQHYFMAEDYYTGFSEILQYVKNALRGGSCGLKPGELSAGQIVGIVFGVIIGVAMIVGLVVCCVGFFQSWECVINTCIGIVISAVLRAFQMVINAIVFACVSAACNALGLDSCCECEPLDCVSGDDGPGVGAGLEY